MIGNKIEIGCDIIPISVPKAGGSTILSLYPKLWLFSVTVRILAQFKVLVKRTVVGFGPGFNTPSTTRKKWIGQRRYWRIVTISASDKEKTGH